MHSRTLLLASLSALIVLAAGCAAQRQNSGASREANLTAGTVQREIHTGESGAAVAKALGAPNIVTRDSNGDETWIYDKIATYASYEKSGGGVSGRLGGGGLTGRTLLLGGIGGAHAHERGSSSSSEKTLTVIIKFDKNQKVKSFSYNASTF
ncbi:MAG: hypothetical protein P8018_06840 [Acidobacteriota bacterium]